MIAPFKECNFTVNETYKITQLLLVFTKHSVIKCEKKTIFFESEKNPSKKQFFNKKNNNNKKHSNQIVAEEAELAKY